MWLDGLRPLTAVWHAPFQRGLLVSHLRVRWDSPLRAGQTESPPGSYLIGSTGSVRGWHLGDILDGLESVSGQSTAPIGSWVRLGSSLPSKGTIPPGSCRGSPPIPILPRRDRRSRRLPPTGERRLLLLPVQCSRLGCPRTLDSSR